MLDHAEGPILSDSHYVFPTLARRVLSLNLALSGRFMRLANFCFKTTARIKIMSLEVVFGALAVAECEIEFPLRGDLGVAQSDFLQKCRNHTNINDNGLKS